MITCRLVGSSCRASWLPPGSCLVLSRGPIPIRPGVSGSPGSHRSLAWSYHVDPSRLVPLPLAPAVVSSGPLTWTPPDSYRCLGSRRRLVWSSLVDPSRLVPVSLTPPAPAGVSSGPLAWTRPDSYRNLAPVGDSSGPLTWTRPDWCRCFWFPWLPPVSRLVLSRGPVPTCTDVWAPAGSSSGPLTWTHTGVSGSPGSRRSLVWSSHVDPSRLVPVSRLPPGTRLVLSVDPFRLVSVSLAPPGTRTGPSDPYSCWPSCVDHPSAGPLELLPLVSLVAPSTGPVLCPELDCIGVVDVLACAPLAGANVSRPNPVIQTHNLWLGYPPIGFRHTHTSYYKPAYVPFELRGLSHAFISHRALVRT